MLDFVLLTLLNSCIQAYFPTVKDRGGLSLVRDALVTDTIRDIIDDEFVLLYDAYIIVLEISEIRYKHFERR